MDINNFIRPMIFTFKTTHGKLSKVYINFKRRELTLEQLLIKYLDEIDHSELVDRNDKIQFLYNTQQLKFGDKTTIGQLFSNENNPTILVMDPNNLLSNNSSKKINTVFENSDGTKITIVVNYGTTVE